MVIMVMVCGDASTLATAKKPEVKRLCAVCCAYPNIWKNRFGLPILSKYDSAGQPLEVIMVFVV
jgi:hypothetical protein